jgi:hypothetical protein
MMRRTLYILIIAALALLFLIFMGCSGSGSSVAPTLDEQPELREPAMSSDRYLIGYWTVHLDPVAQSYEIIPKRDVAFHANIRFFLEQSPCSNCLYFDQIYFYPGDEVRILVRISHPFDDPFLDGFDVRAVPILVSTLTFDSLRLSHGVLDEPDGWTYLWDNTSIAGNLNPYKAYNKTTARRRFPAGTSSSIWMDFDFTETGWTFDYAVDASWDWPDGTNFPTTANCEEAYRVDTSVDGDVWENGLNTVTLTADVYDWQGHNTIGNVEVRAPALFTGAKVMSKQSGVDNLGTFQIDISNELGASPGTYPILIVATDDNHTSTNHLRAYQLAWVDVINYTAPPPGSVTITNPSVGYNAYSNITPYVNNITAQVTPAESGVGIQWWWTDPDEPETSGAYGETGNYETDTDPNDNERDTDAGIYFGGLTPESFPGPTPPEEYHYYTAVTNVQGKSTITFKVSDYGGDNYTIHVRRTDTMDEDTSPLITVKRKVTLYKSSMMSTGGTPGFYEPDHALVQTGYTPAYIDFYYQVHNPNVPYQYALQTDANWLYNYASNIYSPGVHQLADVGANRFTNANVLGIALFSGPYMDPDQLTILATGRIREVYNPDAPYENSVLIHELGHNFGLDHVVQGTGIMEPACTGKLTFCRASLTLLRSDPGWE